MHLLKRLEPLDDLGEYWIRSFMGEAAARRPGSVAALLRERLRIATTRDGGYRPVPWAHDRPLLSGLEGTAEQAQALREVRDTLLASGKGLQRWHAAELFGLLSVGYGPTSLAVLSEWLESRDCERIVLAGTLLKDAPWEFVFSHESFVAEMLTRAHAVGDDCYRRAAGTVLSVATSGIWQSAPGQPAPRHIQQRDRAAEVALRYPEGSPVRRFYEAVRDDAVRSIEQERIRDEEDFVE